MIVFAYTLEGKNTIKGNMINICPLMRSPKSTIGFARYYKYILNARALKQSLLLLYYNYENTKCAQSVHRITLSRLSNQHTRNM